ncbi:MurR/RpiR family transcriptional regulator [Meridianimarinicoccus sp. RP-17]|uniref:MurR/RpiR family transcriptional regulator n=1 Tax=Meridianimarinicoccus zhengii TaxID=2056810 RepID=UPI000DAC05F9|nr:MurR/RpiR family transcriptional regulator [Phycocomes zhengii]
MDDAEHAPGATGKPDSVAAFRERLLNERHLFTNRMLDAGAWVIANQRIVALETLSVMAEKSRLTPSIFVRLAKAMGFDGFSDMQRLFRAPLHDAFPASLSERISHSLGDEVVNDPTDPRAIGQSFCRANSASLAHLGGRLGDLPLDAAIDLILGARAVHVIGLDRSFPVAAYFAYALRRARVQTIQITGMGSLAVEHVDTMRPGDLLISISFPPYAGQTLDATEAARLAGHDIIAITDTPVSPITEAARAVLTVDDAELHGFRSLTAVMSLVQTLAIGLAYRMRDTGDLDLDLINA